MKRKKEEILEEYDNTRSTIGDKKLFLEVLLDIRDILSNMEEKI